MPSQRLIHHRHGGGTMDWPAKAVQVGGGAAAAAAAAADWDAAATTMMSTSQHQQHSPRSHPLAYYYCEYYVDPTLGVASVLL